MQYATIIILLENSLKTAKLLFFIIITGTIYPPVTLVKGTGLRMARLERRLFVQSEY